MDGEDRESSATVPRNGIFVSSPVTIDSWNQIDVSMPGIRIDSQMTIRIMISCVPFGKAVPEMIAKLRK